MYYHEFISMIAQAMRDEDIEAVDQLRHKAYNYLLSDPELEALEALADAAIDAIESIND